MLLAEDPPPKTFVEWGVPVPFTTPLVAHGRVRPTPRGRIELIMPSPAGGRGFWILDLAAAGEAVKLTLHDRLLIERVLALPVISPSEIRRIGRGLAMEGAAGPAAADAAAQAAQAEETEQLLTYYHVVVRLLKQTGLDGLDWTTLAGDKKDETRGRLRDVLRGVAPNMGLEPDGVLDCLEDISLAAAPIGYPGAEFMSRSDRQLQGLRSFAEQLRSWSAGEDGPRGQRVTAIHACLARSEGEAVTALASARPLLEDVMELVRQWCAERREVAATIAQPEWLLDPWERILASWDAAAALDRSAQWAVLEELEVLLPLFERRNLAELDQSPAETGRMQRGRRVRLFEDWRTGLVLLDAIARYERLRAAAP